jgi:putative ABC transport system permease protein
VHLRDLFKDTIQTLWAHKLRTFLTMFGMAWGIVSIVLMTAAGEGLAVGQAKVAEGFSKDLMIVFAGRTSTQAGGLRAGRRVRWNVADLNEMRARTPDCRLILPELGQDNVRIRSSYNDAGLLVTGSEPEFARVRSIDIARGRFYNDDDLREKRRVGVLGTEADKQLFPGKDSIGQTIYINNLPFTVIGVMKKKEQDSSYDGRDINKIFVPFTVMEQDFPNPPPDPPGTLDRVLVEPNSYEHHEVCKGEVRRALGAIYGFDPTDKEAAGIWDTVENAKAFRQMTDGMKYFLGAVGVVTLFLGGLGVMNVMLVSVRERTREIGVRKAVGATAETIMRQFFAESVMVAALSGAIGFIVAFGFCGLVNLLPMPPFFAGLLWTWTSALLSFGLLSLIAVLSAMYPARRAAIIDPIEALRHEAGG